MSQIAAQLKQIGDQLRGMTVSQRIAIVLLVVILIGGMWGMTRLGGSGEWTPLLDQSFTAEQIQKVQAELSMIGVKSKVEADRVLIRGDEDERRRLTALLAQRSALPRDISLGYVSLVKQSSVFMGDRSRQWMEHRGLEAELSSVIGRFNGVKDAHVFIEVPQQRSLRGETAGSRASVHVTLGDGESLDKQRVAAIANFIVGAVTGLEYKNVKITDGVRSYRVPDANDAVPTELLDVQRQAEEHHSQKIYDQLRYIPGVLVAVHAKLADSDEQSQQRTLGPAVVDTESSRTEETTSGSGASAPGVRPNQGRAMSDGGTGSSTAKEETETSLKGDRDLKTVSTVKHAGFVQKLSVSVNVPRSYLMRIASAMAADNKKGAAADASIEKLAETELPKIRTLVKPLINATSDDQVVVNWYYDMPVESTPKEPQTQPSSVVAMAKTYGAQAGLALLACFGLFMVMRMAKSAQAAMLGPTPAGAMAGAGGGNGSNGAWGSGSSFNFDGSAPNGHLPRIGGGPITVGEAQEMDGVMVGHEIDENVVRAQQIVNQISQLVKEDPQSAAGIVNEWLQDEHR